MSKRIEAGSLPAGRTIRIGVPAEQPKEALESLVRLFSETENVISARFGLMEILHPDGTSEFTYTVGLECSAGEDQIIQETLNVLKTVPAGRWPISLMPATNQFFTKEAIVFYERNSKPMSRLSRLFGRK